MSGPKKPGIVLLNLGTPDAPQTPEVRRYLKEFLSDPFVIDINPVARWLLVNLIIAPFRSPKSAEAYRVIWTEQGSPLLFNTQALVDAVRERLDNTPIELAMRYGRPSVASALRSLHEQGCDEITVFPLYPQYAESSTRSSIEKVREEAARLSPVPSLRFVEAFYEDPGFIAAFASVGRPVLEQLEPDHVLFSFHGLPERHVQKTDHSGKHCLASPDCCASMCEANRDCYRAQSHATARALARELGLEDGSWSVSFQSRLGRAEWIKPYTTPTIEALAKQGIEKLAVFCPAFVADCLETLEEVAVRETEGFIAAGGKELRLVPSLNGEPAWADAVVSLLERTRAS